MLIAQAAPHGLETSDIGRWHSRWRDSFSKGAPVASDALPLAQVLIQVVGMNRELPARAQVGFLRQPCVVQPRSIYKFIRTVGPDGKCHRRNCFHDVSQMLFLAPELPNTPLIESPEQRYSDGRAEQTKPPGAPPRRKDLDQHGCAWLAPGTPARRTLCAKRVNARRQGGIGQPDARRFRLRAMCRPILPACSDTGWCRAQVAESGECQGENTLLMRERQAGAYR